jgi:hypothetical protein
VKLPSWKEFFLICLKKKYRISMKYMFQ